MTELETYEDVTPVVEQTLREASVRMPEFAREELRERLVEYARATSAGRWSRAVFSRVAAVAIGCSLAGGGLAQAAASALPGEPLYPAKRVVEAVRLAVASSSDSVEGLLDEISGERAEELTELVSTGAEEDRVDRAAESFVRSTGREGAQEDASARAERMVREATTGKPTAVREKVEREVDEHRAAGKGAGKPSGGASGSGKGESDSATKGGGKP